MIRKGQGCWSAASAKVGLLHGFILGLSLRQAKFPIIYPDLGSTTKLQHISASDRLLGLPQVTHECELFYRQAPGVNLHLLVDCVANLE